MIKKLLVFLIIINLGSFFSNNEFILLNSNQTGSENDKLLVHSFNDQMYKPSSQSIPTQSSEEFFNFSLYQFFPNSVTWQQAKLHCEDLQLNLVTISSTEENFFLTNLAEGRDIWIGFTDEENEGNWQWVTEEPIIYTNWNEGQPDDWGDGEDHAVLGGEELWNDIGPLQGLNQENPYICESQQSLNDTQLSTGSFNSSYYRVFYTPMTWEQAKINCEDLQMHLVTITSPEENLFLNNLAKYTTIWLGLTDEDNEGKWVWITGELLVYTNWDGDEPNDSGIGEDYAEMFGSGWNDNGGPADYELKILSVCESKDSDQDEIPDHIEVQIGLDPYKNDTNEDLDGDDMPNLWEYEMGLNLTINDAADDPDQDGLSNLEEYELGTSPRVRDTDQDGMDDQWEVEMNLNPLKNDAEDDKDGDLISNLVEYTQKSNANNFWNVPFLKSEFPFIYLSLPLLLIPVILATFSVMGGGLGFVIKNNKRRRLIEDTNAPDYETALLVKKGKFFDYEEFKLAKEMNITTVEDYKLALELKELEKEFRD
ncbi:MAG: hypothetical protein HeimC3_14730 [Candidatus Heimdallarchaeota archaeon LC_3]|nr:MAG: hypothetical protein HeimC3_14730 [Candidatus Heimdallarchaeota archaeon LC_3]